MFVPGPFLQLHRARVAPPGVQTPLNFAVRYGVVPATPPSEDWIMATELWTTSEVQRFIGYAQPQSARTWCLRKGLKPEAMRSSTGELLWNAEAVQAAWNSRPGRGYRSDVHGPPAPPEGSAGATSS